MSACEIPDDPFVRRTFRLPRREVAYLRFLVEGYDGLVFLRTLEGREALVEISYPPSRGADACAFVAALEAELGLSEVAVPSSPPPSSV